MAKVTALQSNFTAGELSPRLYGRVDITKYRNGAKTLENVLVSPYGGARKRGGTRWVQNTIGAAFGSLLVPFVYSTEQAYVIEFGQSRIRFFQNKGILVNLGAVITNVVRLNPCRVTAVAHGYSTGDKVILESIGGTTEINNLVYTVTVLSADVFELDGIDASTFTTYTSGGVARRIVEIASPYAADELDELSFAQSNDVLFIAHPNHPIKRLERLSSTSWQIVDASIVGGPFRPINSNKTNTMSFALSATTYNLSAATQANPCVVTTTTAHGFGEGESITFAGVGGMVALNGTIRVARNVTSTTFEVWDAAGRTLDSSAYGAFTAGGTVARSLTPWGTISEGATQVTVTMAANSFTADMEGMLLRAWEPGLGTGVSGFSYGDPVTAGQQYTNDGKVYGCFASSGLTNWDDGMTPPTHVDGTVRIYRYDAATNWHELTYLHSLYSVLEITDYVSSTVATCKVNKGHIPKSCIDLKTTYWERGAWNDYFGWPSAITLFEQRIWGAATDTDGAWIWGSKSGSFADFSDGVNDGDAVSYQIAANGADKILWLVPSSVLAVGTGAGEYVATPSNRNEALTPTNARIARQTPLGSAPVQPIQVGSAVMFAERYGKSTNPARKLREFLYDFNQDSFRSNDLTLLSEHVTETGIAQLAYQQAPDSIVWSRRTDGRLATMVYEPSQEVVGWMRQTLGGPGLGTGNIAKVVRMTSIPGTDGDELWMVVQRVINGAQRHTIEVLERGLDSLADKEDAYFVDCGATYDGSLTTTVSGLNHLEGETVSILADGATHPDVIVSGGRVTLNREARVVHIGYGYTATIETLDLEAGAQAGTAQTRTRRIAKVWARVNRSLGGKIGRGSVLEPVLYRTTETPLGSSSALFSGLVNVDFPKGYDRECVIKITQDQPLPLEVLSVIPELDTQG